MEHLPSPVSPYEPLRCICSPESLRQMNTVEASFFDFPAAAGISLKQVKQGRLDTSLTRARLAVFLQSWLFIRLLEHVLDTSVHLDLVTQHDEVTNNHYLYSGNLPAILSQLNLDSLEQVTRVKAALAEASVVMNRIAVHNQDPARATVSGELEVLLWTTIQTLEFALLPDDLPRQRVQMSDGGRICTLLTTRLLNLQWCPNLVDMLAHSLDVPGLYYASLLGPNLDGEDHGKCSQRECLVKKIVQSEYRTKHVGCSGACDFVSVDSGLLEDIVNAEIIPIIESLETGDANQLVMQVHPESDQTPYVAISHVWADGMGNPEGNSLPTCHLHRLRRLVSQLLPERPLFWCDTLCVPTKPPELRRKAIWKMKAVYERAAHVLVIDSGLMMASSEVSPEELLMRITSCGWVRRLWTFQEKYLARRLHVVVRDSIIIRVEHLHNQVMSYRVNPETGTMSARSYSSSIALEASSFLRDGQRKANGGLNQRLDFGSVWESVQWRTTSWPSDEPICLAVALGMDLRGILELPEDTALRMRAILSQQTGIPPYIIFAPVPRMDVMGWRWAPHSLMRPRAISGAKLHHMNDTTRWQPEGLVVQFPGFVAQPHTLGGSEGTSNMRQLPMTVGSSFAMKDVESGSWYWVWRQREDWASTNVEDILNDLVSEKMATVAVILSCPVAALWPTAEKSPGLWDGILVSITKQAGDVLFASFVWRLLVGWMPPSSTDDAEKDLAEGPTPVSADYNRVSEDEADSVYLSALRCKTMGPSQEWCVG